MWEGVLPTGVDLEFQNFCSSVSSAAERKRQSSAQFDNLAAAGWLRSGDGSVLPHLCRFPADHEFLVARKGCGRRCATLILGWHSQLKSFRRLYAVLTLIAIYRFSAWAHPSPCRHTLCVCAHHALWHFCLSATVALEWCLS